MTTLLRKGLSSCFDNAHGRGCSAATCLAWLIAVNSRPVKAPSQGDREVRVSIVERMDTVFFMTELYESAFQSRGNAACMQSEGSGRGCGRRR